MADNTLIIKGGELKKIISSFFPNVKHLITTDRDYALLDLEWVEKHAYSAFIEWIQVFGFKRKIRFSYWKTNWDCEDLSESFKAYLRFLHAAANSHTLTERMDGKENITNATSVSAGTMFYKNYGDRSGGHAINILLSKDMKPAYFEPEAGVYINLNNEQKKSVWYVNF
jgi:hypothetical protein